MSVIAICVLLVLVLVPLLALAESRDPLSFYSLRQYGWLLGIALLGGLVSWIAKVRRGELRAWNLMALVGELCTSAFAGLVCFWLCDAAGVSMSWSVPLVGIAGHMGTRAIAAFESFAMRRWGAVFPGESQE